jgi:hypothetical protein
MAFKEVDPLTGKRRRSGGRQAGTPNRTTSARYAAMARVNEALAAIGEDALTGIKLLREVLNHKDTPLDVKIQCAGLLTRHEQIEAADHKYVAEMPAVMPGRKRESNSLRFGGRCTARQTAMTPNGLLPVSAFSNSLPRGNRREESSEQRRHAPSGIAAGPFIQCLLGVTHRALAAPAPSPRRTLGAGGLGSDPRGDN